MTAHHEHDRSELDRFWEPGVRAWPVAVIAGLAAFALYAATASPYVGIYDVAEMQGLAGTGGIAHAGYPTLVLILRLVGQVPLGALAWRANLLGALLGAPAVAALAYAAMRLTRQAGLSLLAALAFAVSCTMWSESARIGVHALTLALGSIAFIVALGFLHSPSRPRALWLGLLTGLGLTCHLTSLAFLLPLAWTLWRVAGGRALRAAHVVLLVLGVVVGLAPFAYTLARDRPGQRINYMDDTFVPGNGPGVAWGPGLGPRAARLIWLLSGEQYLSDEVYSIRALPRHAAGVALNEAVNEFPLPALAVAAVGLWMLLGSGGAVAWLSGAWLLGALVCTARGGTEDTGPWFFFPGTWLLGLGLAFAYARVRAWRRAPAFALAVVITLLPLARLSMKEPPALLRGSSLARTVWSRWPQRWSPFRHDARYDHFGRAAMVALPPGAIVLGHWGPVTVLRYFAWAEGLRPDVDVRFAPNTDGERFQRRRREAGATGRPVFSADPPAAAQLADGSASTYLECEGLGLWSLRTGAPR